MSINCKKILLITPYTHSKCQPDNSIPVTVYGVQQNWPKYQCLFITNALSGLSCSISAQQTLFCASSHNLIEKAVIIDSMWGKSINVAFKGGS